MRTAQENLRLSAGTLNKLQGEFKNVCEDLDATRKKLNETESAWKKLRSDTDSKIELMSNEIQRLNGIIEKKNN